MRHSGTDNWVQAVLSDLIDIKHGFAFEGQYFRDEPPGDVLLTPGNFAIGGGFKDGKLKYYDGPVPDDFVLNEGDLLVTMTDLSKAADTLGYPAIIPSPNHTRFLHNQRLGKVIVRRDDLIDKKYLFHLLRTKPYRDEVIASATGTTVKHTSPSRVLAFRFLRPSLDEQRAIADILGSLDDKIELNQRTNRTLEQMAAAIFKAWFVDFDPVKAKGTGAKSFPSMPQAIFDSLPTAFIDSPLGPIPKGWVFGAVGDSTSLIIDHRGKTPKKLGGDWSQSGIPAVSAKNIKSGRLVERQAMNYVDETMYRVWMREALQVGDILLTSEAPMGEMFYLARATRYCLSQRVFALRAAPQRVLPIYLYHWLNSDASQERMEARATGTTVVGIRQSELRKVEVVLPPLSVQGAAAEYLNAWMAKSALNAEETDTLASVRDALLPKLLSGEIRVKDAVMTAGEVA